MAVIIQQIDVTISDETLRECKRTRKKIYLKVHQYAKGVSADHDITVGLNFINVKSYYNARGVKRKERINIQY